MDCSRHSWRDLNRNPWKGLRVVCVEVFEEIPEIHSEIPGGNGEMISEGVCVFILGRNEGEIPEQHFDRF